MANKLSLGLVIGGAVDSSLGAAFKNVSGEMKKLEAQTTRAKGLQKVIGETMRLRDEWKKAHDSGAANADALLRKLETNTNSLRKQGVEVGRLRQEYLALGKVVRSAEFKAKGLGQVEEGRESLRSGFGTAVAGTTLAAVPTKISADFQAIVRDIAIKSGTANTQQEVNTAREIVQTSKDIGMANTQVAELVNQLVGGGMDLTDALKYAPVAAKFAVGQGASGTDTAKMILAMQNNAKITDPKKMEQALASVALLGQQGSFEAADMAKWFPELLAQMASSGITGQEAVSQLGAMLQVQIKSAGSADEAANNLKNWIAKIGSGETVKGYADAGIDYQASMNAAIAKGLSTVEASFELARRYVEKTDPKMAQQLQQGLSQIGQETDPAKAQAMADALAATLRTGDLFADMQVKTALMAYTQNKKLYADLKKDASNPDGQRKDILDKNLSERREASSQRWAETGQAFNDSLRAIGDALRPATDALATGIGVAARGLTALSEEAPKAVLGLAALTAGALVLGKAWATLKIGRGLANIVRGAAGDRSNIVQRVFVTNTDDGLDPGKDGPGKSARGRGSKGAGVMKVGGALAAVGAGVLALDTYQNATSRDEKAEGYGEAAGSLAGGLAGAAAGAAIGSIIPVVGTAIGGIIGSMIGAWGGGEIGSMMSKALFGGADMPANAPLAGQGLGAVVRSMDSAPATPVMAALMAQSGPATPPAASKVDQQFTFAPAPVITVQGDVKDPAQLAQELMPYLRRQFEDFAREARARQLFDAPHVS